jgi:CDP-diacylglycerol--glycerol-3-phosphate 3-phosphatidyltransferase
MASVYVLKPRFQALLRPLVRLLAHHGITANHVTVLATLLSFLAGASITGYPAARWPLILMPLALFVRMALNAIDGMLAREHGMKSNLGAILNELGDVASDIALYLPLALVPGISVHWIVSIVILAIVSEMTGVLAVQIGAARRYDGPMGKSDRAFVIGLFSLLLGLGWFSARWFNAVLMLISGLLLATIVNRARRGLAAAA